MRKTKEQISFNMSRIGCKDTKIELLLRKELWKRKLRYQKNVKSIIGKPDIVFKGEKIAIFCDSEFWHGFNWEERKKQIKSNTDYWIPKIERNIQRDKEVNQIFLKKGWDVLRFWGNDIKQHTKEIADIIESLFHKKRIKNKSPKS